MRYLLSGLFIFSLLLPTLGKPGESYVLTGKEKSIFGIFQEDMKAYPEYYEDVDVNYYYEQFKYINKLDSGRKLKVGAELIFPHTKRSKELHEAQLAEEARAVEKAEREAAKQAEKAEREAVKSMVTNEAPSELFGSDLPAHLDPEVRRKNARLKAINSFYHQSLPRWMLTNDLGMLKSGNAEQVIKLAAARVDDAFSTVIQLHRYPEKKIYILEFEKPARVEDYYFFAIKVDENGEQSFYALEKGLSMFGAGDVSKLRRWHTSWDSADLGGRKYNTVNDFLADLETGSVVGDQ